VETPSGAQVPADGWEVLELAGELARRGESFALATVVWRQGPSSSQQGSRAIITAGGELRGWIGGACAEPAVLRQAQEVIASGKPRLLLLGSSEQFGGAVPDGMRVVPIACQSEGALEVYVEPVLASPHLVVVGRSPMARTLAELARTLGWHADLIDGADFGPQHAGQHSLVVVATQGHDDEAVMTQAIAARPAYLGLVGSGRRGAAVLGYLAERGLPKDELDKVRVPAGLDLGRTTHTEIAVAILAELVQLRASGALTARRAENGKAQRDGAQREAAQGEKSARRAQSTTDPVCGMTVTAGQGALSVRRDGTTYYFCCTGCRQAFEADPAAYANRLPT
jgi:xanthine dehydrogenase accessory factor